ncbi:hypothetical protein [Erwinia rhapontici]|uniref:hypothetical protein n=1 Tax=Erwinia rhapontici TaxID=55212 RepID=UPI003B9FDD07
MENKDAKKYMLYFGMLCVVVGAGVALFGNAVNASVLIVTGLALLLLTIFDLESLKLLGLEAKLSRKLIEAEEIINKLRKTSIPLAKLAVSTAAKAGRWDSAFSTKEMHDFVSEFEITLIDIGADTDDIKNFKMEWVISTARDAIHEITTPICNLIHNKYSSEKSNAEHEIIFNSPIDDEETMARTYDLHEEYEKCKKLMSHGFESNYSVGIREFIKGTSALTVKEKDDFFDENNENIEDIHFLLNEGKIRRPNIFA